MTKTLAKSREQQNATRFIKTTLLLSTLLLSLSVQSFAASADDLLRDLMSSAPTNQVNASVIGGVKASGVFNSQVDSYAGKVKAAIQKEFRDFDSFRGRTCELQLKISSDGLLESITPKNSPSNDITLCNAAIKAAELAIMPPAPSSLEVINVLNKSGSTLVFKP